MTIAVIDATVLSNFAHLKNPELLNAAFEASVTVEAVMREIQAGVDSARLPSVDWSWLLIAQLTAPELVVAAVLKETLGKGESECIALAQSREGIIVTDDRDARNVARKMNVSISGTLGALNNLVEQQALSISEADEALRLMRLQGYRSPVKSFTEFKRLMGE